MTNIKPIGKRLVVRPDTVEDRTASGLLLQVEDRIKQNQGTVVAIGNETMSISVGDTILYNQYSGCSVTVDSEDLLILNESDVIALI